MIPVQTGCASHSAGDKTTTRTTFHIPASIPNKPQHPLDDAVPGVPNFGIITRDVWRGAEPTPEGLTALAGLGVKTVIDLRMEDEYEVIPKGVSYVRIPVSAWHADRLDVARVLRAVKENPKPVFIHCEQGRDRTGYAVAAYRISEKMSPADACQELRNFHVNPWWQGAIERRIYELDRRGLPK